MDGQRVFIIGNSMFAESIAHLLLDHQELEIVGSAPTLDLALFSIDDTDPDAIIVVSTDGNSSGLYAELLVRYPDLSIVATDLNTDKVRVITSQCVQARRTDLLAALTALPKRG